MEVLQDYEMFILIFISEMLISCNLIIIILFNIYFYPPILLALKYFYFLDNKQQLTHNYF